MALILSDGEEEEELTLIDDYTNLSVDYTTIKIQKEVNGQLVDTTSEDGVSFNGYHYATWAQIEAAYTDSDRVLWNVEYVGGTPTLIAD